MKCQFKRQHKHGSRTHNYWVVSVLQQRPIHEIASCIQSQTLSFSHTYTQPRTATLSFSKCSLFAIFNFVTEFSLRTRFTFDKCRVNLILDNQSFRTCMIATHEILFSYGVNKSVYRIWVVTYSKAQRAPSFDIVCGIAIAIAKAIAHIHTVMYIRFEAHTSRGKETRQF